MFLSSGATTEILSSFIMINILELLPFFYKKADIVFFFLLAEILMSGAFTPTRYMIS